MMQTPLQRAICFFASTVRVLRSSEGHYDKGRWVEGPTQEVEIQASIQPADGEDLKRLEEGRREHETIKIYTSFRLNTSSRETQTDPDILIWQGKKFQIEQVDNWSDEGKYFKAIGIKIE